MNDQPVAPTEDREPRAAVPTSRVFISHASPDASTAGLICAALESAGLPCWMAPRDVRAGESYAAAIVQAINSCRTLVLVLSKSAIDSPHVLREVERASSKGRPVIAYRTDDTALTPDLEYFLSSNHWLDASGGPVERLFPALIDSIGRAGSGPGASALPLADSHRRHELPTATPAPGALPPSAARRPTAAVLAVSALALAMLVYLGYDKLASRAPPVPPTTPEIPRTAAPSPASAAFTPPPHSIAVLPFVNMSGDPKQDYFSDGLSEELLNSLASVHDLQVAARTSSFSFKGTNTDVADIARKLNVGAVLEGSVRKDGNQVRITAQLINATSGYHVWSQTYDRDLKNVLSMQTEIATAVTKALTTTLMADAASTLDVGGTQNAQAHDAYLRALSLERKKFDRPTVLAIQQDYEQAIAIDPKFAKAYAGLSFTQGVYASNFAINGEVAQLFVKSRDNAQKAIALAPDLGSAHAALAVALVRGWLDFAGANAELEKALALSPNDADTLARAGIHQVGIGQTEQGLAMLHRAITLDPLNPHPYTRLGAALRDVRRYEESNAALDQAQKLAPEDAEIRHDRGLNYFALGRLELAEPECATLPTSWTSHLCNSLLFYRQHRLPEAKTALEAFQHEFGDSAAYQYAEVYAQWGDTAKALDWLEKAYALPDSGILGMRNDSLIDPLRNEPRFKAVLARLNYPTH